MDDSVKRSLQRYATLLVVLALHVVLIALLLTKSRSAPAPKAQATPVQLLLLAPAKPPRVRAQNPSLGRIRGDLSRSLTLPLLNPSTPVGMSTSASSTGKGSGVDWVAEARRSLQAFEIRNHEPRNNHAISNAPTEDSWWPQTSHRAGDRFKTADGDWIVWINATCYQVASSGPNVSPASSPLAGTVCEDRSEAAAQEAASQEPKAQ